MRLFLLSLLASCTIEFPTCIKDGQACSEQASSWCLSTEQSELTCMPDYEAQCDNGQCVSYEEQIVCLASLDRGMLGTPPVVPTACLVTWIKH